MTAAAWTNHSTLGLGLAVAVTLTQWVCTTTASQLCSLPSREYDTGMQQHPETAFAVHQLRKYATAVWYSDNKANGDYAQLARDLVATCGEATTMTLVVYGLPNKDCEANYSNDGSNKTPQDYQQFIQTLADIIGQRKILYVLEPDAVGLTAKQGGCGQQAGYEENIAKAIGILSANPNAEIYLDVGYWTLMFPESSSAVTQLVHTLSQAGRIKGITLNTSNYRSNAELSQLCSNFQNAMGSDAMHCIIDSSRNYNGAPASNEWCNTKSGGIGKPPTSDTGYPNIDALIWIKPPGESDGPCDGGDRTSDAMRGPPAGRFFVEGLTSLWNNGYFVKELHMPMIDGTVRPVATTAPATAPPPMLTAPPTPPLMTPPPSTATAPPTTTAPQTSPPTTAAPLTTKPFNTSALTDETERINPTPMPSLVSVSKSRAPPQSIRQEATTKTFSTSNTPVGHSNGLVVVLIGVAVAMVIVVAVVVVKTKQENSSMEPLKTPVQCTVEHLPYVSM